MELSDPRVSPDGTSIAFVVRSIDAGANEYRSAVWLTDADGASPPRQLTDGRARDRCPRWSPDGRWLAFVSSRDASPSAASVLLLPLRGGEARSVVTHDDDIDDLAWSPDGSRLAYTARVGDVPATAADKDRPPRRIEVLGPRVDAVGWVVDRRSQVHVVDAAAGATPHRITDGPFEHQGVAWAPDSSSIVTCAGRHHGWDRDGVVDLWQLDPAGGEPRRLTASGPAFSRPTWSGDGALVVCCQDDERLVPTHTQVMAVDVATGLRRGLSLGLDRNCCPTAPPSCAALPVDGSVLFTAEDGGNVPLLAVATDGGSVTTVVGGERQISAFDHAGGTLAVIVTEAHAPGELAVLRAGDTALHVLTDFAAALRGAVTLATPERFSATSADGTPVDAWLLRPVDAGVGPHPTLVNIHGGPFGQYGNRFLDELHLQSAAGFAVVYANLRGSSGYSQDFGRALRWPEATQAPGHGWGGDDFADLMAVVDEAVRCFDCVDGERLGVLGGSYGGYLTSWAIAHTDRFKAACSERAVNNLLTMTYTSDIGIWFNEGYVGASHLDAPELYHRRSPVTYVKEMRTPLLILHSEDDWRCPISQAEELFVDLHLLGRDVEFVRFPGEGHELSRSGSPAHRIERARIILDWFARKL